MFANNRVFVPQPIDRRRHFRRLSIDKGVFVTKIIIAVGWWVLSIAPFFVYATDEAISPPTAITPDGGRYWGPLVGGLREGEGRVEWSNGAFYSGSFVNGLFSGKGRLRSPAGDIVEGDFEQGLPYGTITLTTNTGSVYEGQARLGQLEGRGRLQDNDNVYEGDFKDNLYHGQGHLVSPAHEYTGQFHQGQFWGKGELRQKNGRTYKGDFVRGEFEGQGLYVILDGPTYEGEFVDGKLQGHGLITYPNGAKQEGEFRDWQLDGLGKYTDPEGNTFEGEFKAGQLVGVATALRTDGTRYVGEMHNWVPHGQGELHLDNGDIYRGGFSYGMYEGQGTLSYAKPQSDGRTQDTGVWEYGRLKKQAEDERRRNRANIERALYTQADQLNHELRKLKPSPGKSINMYFLAIAGDGTQEVFRREVDFIRAQFEEKFATRGHAVALINSRNTVGSRPLATVTSVRKAISAIAAKMDKERDILFLYLTSHGSKEGAISLELEGMRFPDLSANQLASFLKESGIRWKAVIVSACYAGSFMEPLKDDGTLLIAAARADRTSFGCSDENDFTYFGRAFFKESLPSADSFEDAFAKASFLIKKWEDQDNIDQTHATTGHKEKKESVADRHSLPQIEAPEAIREQLKLWRAQFSKKTAHSKTP
ncbi:C13 family peptidase [Propionivibrio soli]|uniref:C13 family peptidase n=1 Tax=Propionivibrio soli TaxID=2976531 RepID=UPI0021E90D17|nr:C13 family peptidase [Propionivibrio soli]